MILEYKASPPSHPAPDQRVHFLADSFKRPGQGPNIYMSSAAPAQKVSGASTIDEFNHWKSYSRVVAGELHQRLPSEVEALTAADSQRAAAKYFDTYRAAVVIVDDWEKVKDQVVPFGDVTMHG